MDSRKDALWKTAEKIVLTDYAMDNIKLIRIMVAKEGNELNILGIRNFLKGYEKIEDLLLILEEINSQDKPLPDFICLDCSDKVFFVEVKNWSNKVTLSAIDEKEAIKTLADKGYMCIIRNVQISDSVNMSDEEIVKCQKEYGQIMKGNSKGKPVYSLSFSERRQSQPYKNVYIFNMEVTQCAS